MFYVQDYWYQKELKRSHRKAVLHKIFTNVCITAIVAAAIAFFGYMTTVIENM